MSYFFSKKKKKKLPDIIFPMSFVSPLVLNSLLGGKESEAKHQLEGLGRE